MATRKPRIEYYWTQLTPLSEHRVNWSLVGANGEIMCQSTQGFRDKTDAQRSVMAVFDVLASGGCERGYREVGPGRKPS